MRLSIVGSKEVAGNSMWKVACFPDRMQNSVLEAFNITLLRVSY